MNVIPNSVFWHGTQYVLEVKAPYSFLNVHEVAHGHAVSLLLRSTTSLNETTVSVLLISNIPCSAYSLSEIEADITQCNHPKRDYPTQIATDIAGRGGCTVRRNCQLRRISNNVMYMLCTTCNH